VPLVRITIVEGALRPWQMRQIVEGVTEVLVAVEGERIRPTTWVIVDEIGGGAWGVGGRVLTAADAKATVAAAARGEETP
jgi:4-oxalocrotonate tautomerase